MDLNYLSRTWFQEGVESWGKNILKHFWVPVEESDAAFWTRKKKQASCTYFILRKLQDTSLLVKIEPKLRSDISS